MNFMDAVRSGFNNYANFSGRALRSEYWWWIVFNWIAAIVAGIIDRALGWSLYQTTMYGVQQTVGPVATIVLLALFIPWLSVAVRRLHDTDRSGWWMLIGFVPIIGSLILLYFFVISGTPGPNKYGPPRDSSALAFPR